MTKEQRSHIESLCRQIEVEQDQKVFVQLVWELHLLLRHWLCEPHEVPATCQSWMDGGPTKSKSNGNGNGHRTADQPYMLANSYEKIVDDAVALMCSNYASLQMLYPERGTGGELRLLAFRGFNPQAAKFWEWVRADSKSTCGIALRTSQRVVAPDIAVCDFMAHSEDQQVYLQTGIQACQTTPLVTRSGNIVGMISTHWRMPHQPSENDLILFDILAREAADLIQREGRKEVVRKERA
jgi:GAF domain-containing protein